MATPQDQENQRARTADDGTGTEATPPAQPLSPGAARAAQMEQALALYCQGLSMAGVARVMGEADTTVRRWIRLALATLAEDARAERRLELQRLIESQRAIARAAWESYYAERDALAQQAAHAANDENDECGKNGKVGAANENDENGNIGNIGNIGNPDENRASGKNGNIVAIGKIGKIGNGPGRASRVEHLPPPRIPQGARYLALALAAQREVARLQGLYDRLAEVPAPMSLTIIRRPDGPENVPPTAPRIVDASPGTRNTGEDSHDD